MTTARDATEARDYLHTKTHARFDTLLELVKFYAERQEEIISELSEPMACGHYGANLQPDDDDGLSHEYCVVCAELAAALSERERETVERCCKAVCKLCREGYAITERMVSGDGYHRVNGRIRVCDASPIRADAARRAGDVATLAETDAMEWAIATATIPELLSVQSEAQKLGDEETRQRVLKELSKRAKSVAAPPTKRADAARRESE